MIVRMRASRRARPLASSFLLAAYLAREAMATLLPPRELVHRIDKIYVQTDTLALERREQSLCPTGHSLCPQSMNGGCCAEGYGCQTDSFCSATTAGQTCAGITGYYACPLSAGAGCCPQGYVCGTKCIPPVGESLSTRTCPPSYYGCPAAAGYGCCKSGMLCGLNACYPSTPVTHVWTISFATTVDGKTTTITTTQTNISMPIEPTALPNNKDSGALPKFIPTQIPKLQVSIVPDPDTGNGGLTTAQLGGIIGGVAGLLVVVLVAAFIILRKLRQTRKAFETSTRRGSSNPDGRTSRQAKPMTQYKPTPSQVDQFEYDDLLQSPDPTVSHFGARGGSQTATEFSPSGTPMPSGGSEPRHVSFDSPEGYFDIPPSRTTHRTQGTVSANSNRPSTDTAIAPGAGRTDSPGFAPQKQHHGRQDSNTSGRSDGGVVSGVGSPLIPAELDSAVGPMPELPVSPVWALYGERGGEMPYYSPSRRSESTSPRRPLVGGHSRRQSGSGPPPVSSTRDRSGSGASSQSQHQQGQPGQQPMGLGVVDESVEHLHGYYGGGVSFAGQTRPRDEAIESDISSPIAVAYQGRPRSRDAGIEDDYATE